MTNFAVATTRCYFCLEPDRLVLNSRMWSATAAAQVQAADGKVLDDEPCPRCAEHMQAGIILISIRDGSPPPAADGALLNPYRTGGWCVLTQSAAVRIFNAVVGADERAVADMLRKRAMFVEDAVWDLIGLPRGATTGDA